MTIPGTGIDVDDKDLGICAMLLIALATIFWYPPTEGKEIVVPIITGIAGFITGVKQ